jgi:MoCo/4Fe-4S cofactor protein with predicted Tat translocation signal
MKRVFEHPPEKLTGKRYWRSLGELSDTPEFRGWLEREFPAGAAQLEGDEWSRRGFLKLMGASMALAGFGLTSCRRPEAHLVPFTKSVEWTIPGKALYYATAMPRRTGALPLIAATVDGRPIKLEGNPLHPSSGGATDAFAQASLLDLYDPARSKRFVEKGEKGQKKENFEPRDRATFEKYLAELRTNIAADGGAGLAFLVEELHSPTRERLRAELLKVYPKMRWCVYDPLLTEAQSFATQLSFGDNARLVPRFERADVVVALDSDFLDCGEGDVAGVRAFSSRRRVTGAKDAMNRRDGRSSDAVSGESDSGLYPSTRGQNCSRHERPGARFDNRHFDRAGERDAVRGCLADGVCERFDGETWRQPGHGRPAPTSRGPAHGLRHQLGA